MAPSMRLTLVAAWLPWAGHINCVEYLLEEGADIEQRNVVWPAGWPRQAEPAASAGCIDSFAWPAVFVEHSVLSFTWLQPNSRTRGKLVP